MEFYHTSLILPDIVLYLSLSTLDCGKSYMHEAQCYLTKKSHWASYFFVTCLISETDKKQGNCGQFLWMDLMSRLAV